MTSEIVDEWEKTPGSFPGLGREGDSVSIVYIPTAHGLEVQSGAGFDALAALAASVGQG